MGVGSTPGDAAAIARAERLLAEGNALEDGGDAAGALERYNAAREASPDHPRVCLNVANALRALGRVDDAIRTLEDALASQPRNARARYNLGVLYAAQSNDAQAQAAFEASLRIDPSMAEAEVALAGVHEASGRTDDAERALRRAIALRPDYADARFRLGLLCMRQDRCEEAEALLRGVDAQALAPGAAASALGELYLAMGRHADAGDAFARAMREDPSNVDVGSGLLFALNFRADVAPDDVFREHARVGALIAQAAGTPYSSWNVAPIAGRRLRVGYVSGDLSQHPVGRFLAPVLARHDAHRFEVHCFSTGTVDDDVTRILRRHARYWHDVAAVSEADLAQRIHALGIDVLVDLSGHTTRHRLGTFARRPAPVQASWLGYLNTTGIAAIGWRLCDRHTDPVGETEALHVERLLRLPHSQWCYQPFADAPEVPAADASGRDVVFGSFNQLVKVTDATLDLWSRVLRERPGTKLVVLDTRPGWSSDRLLARLHARGVARDRVTLVERESPAAYFRRLATVDIALDTFPYNGATTTLDTLWMGTPLVALRGDRGIARGGYSLLTELGATELIAHDEDEYVRLNLRLADDAAWRSRLRASLRDRVRLSPLVDSIAFVHALEDAYQVMWNDWCRRGTAR